MDPYGEGTWMEICVGEVRMLLGFVLYFTDERFLVNFFCKWGGVLLVLVN